MQILSGFLLLSHYTFGWFPDDAGAPGKKQTYHLCQAHLHMWMTLFLARDASTSMTMCIIWHCYLEYIAQSATVQRLFALRAGDVETLDPSTAMPHPPSRGSQISGTDVAPADDSQYYDQYEQQRGQSSQGYYQDQQQSAEHSHTSQQYINVASGAPSHH